MEDLFGRIRDIHEKAELSEKMVQEITRFASLLPPQCVTSTATSSRSTLPSTT